MLLELLLIPFPGHIKPQSGGRVKAVVTSRDFYYAIAAPIILWYGMTRFIPRYSQDRARLLLLFFMFGFYLSSVLQTIARLAYRVSHLPS